MTASVTRIGAKQKDCRLPPGEPPDERGVATAIMPNGSAVCVSHRAPTELTTAMTLAWAEAWAKEQEQENGND